MNRYRKTALFIVATLVLFSLSTLVPPEAEQAQAAGRTLSWLVVNTPSSGPTNVIVSPCEINAMAAAEDNRTVYCADTANSRFFRSFDSGYTWRDISPNLQAAGAQLPVWDVVLAPGNDKFILAVTDKSGAPDGPGQIFYSLTGSTTWLSANFPPLNAGEYISCVDISPDYGATGVIRDIAVGTRNSAGTGRVFTLHYTTTSIFNWYENTQLSQNFNAIKFSPNYDTDFNIVAITSTAVNTLAHVGKWNSYNQISWEIDDYFPYPVVISYDGTSYPLNTIIKCCLALDPDFHLSGIDPKGFFVSLLSDDTDNPSVLLYVRSFYAFYNITPVKGVHISSIEYYYDNHGNSILMAGQSDANPATALVTIWHCLNPQTNCQNKSGVYWYTSASDGCKSPTGGGTTGLGNPILKYSMSSEIDYCGTSSENATIGGTSENTTAFSQWPFCKRAGAALDESAFSRSSDGGNTWNQTGLIDTEISWLSDSAVHELPEGNQDPDLTNILYLSSINNNYAIVAQNRTFDSVWRSLSDPPGDMWERVFTLATSDNGTILRINPRHHAESQVVALADITADNITVSTDKGQLWKNVNTGVKNTQDVCFADDTTLYVLGDYIMRRVAMTGADWMTGNPINTNLETMAHTICSPLKNAATRGGKAEEIAVIGSVGPGGSYVAWIDLAQFNPQFNILKKLPLEGDVHVLTDSRFESNRIIYAAQYAPLKPLPSTDGSILRWKLGTSTDWDDLEPFNRAYFGIETLNDVLYGAWYWDSSYYVNGSGVERTLYPLVRVPPPPEWDDLTAGLPPGSSGSTAVKFTREPSSLHISSNAYNTLWAIDDLSDAGSTKYNLAKKIGCLWQYIDSAAKIGPWPISPPAGSFIGTDPVTGRSQQVDFKWRQLIDMKAYDLLIAKDAAFTLPLSQNLNFLAVDNGTRGSGAWIVEPADWVDPGAWIVPGLLESGQSYYWKVRGRMAISDEIIHSPWSPAMNFAVKPGFMVTSFYQGPTLISPINGACPQCKPPVSFSWTPIKKATKYEFLLAADPGLTRVIARENTTTTSYKYPYNLDYFTPYYWRVRAIEPVPSDFSPVATFSLTGGVSAVTQAIRAVAPGVPMEALIWIIIGLAYLLILLIILYAFISRRD